MSKCTKCHELRLCIQTWKNLYEELEAKLEQEQADYKDMVTLFERERQRAEKTESQLSDSISSRFTRTLMRRKRRRKKFLEDDSLFAVFLLFEELIPIKSDLPMKSYSSRESYIASLLNATVSCLWKQM